MSLENGKKFSLDELTDMHAPSEEEMQNEIPMAVNCAVAAIAKDAGVPIMLNPAPYSKLPRELIEMVTYVTPNEHEAKDMTGVEIKTSADVEKALDVLCSLMSDNN